MRSRRPVLPAILVALIVAACTTTVTPRPTTAPTGGPTVLPQIVNSELGVGKNRVILSFLDRTGTTPVAKPDRTVSVTFANAAGATAAATAPTFIWAIEDVVGIYALEADFPSAGPWKATFTTSAPGSPTETIPFDFDVVEKTSVIRPGTAAPSVDTPTAADVGGDLARLSTDPTPVPAFYTSSIADALAAKQPFVVVFATPRFCQTAQCGPTLERLKPIAAAHPDVTFIHVEPYELQFADGALQPVLDDGAFVPVDAVTAWGLRVEPYLFVIDAAGTVAASFELIFGEDELDAAIDALG